MSAARGFPLSVRIPLWSRTSSIRVQVAGRAQPAASVAGVAGSMAVVELPAGQSTVVISFELAIRVERRAPYVLSKTSSWDANAATVHRGPVHSIPSAVSLFRTRITTCYA